MNAWLPYSILAQEAPASPQGALWQTLMMLGIAFVFFYFILWRPEQKRRKSAEEMRAALKKGDRVTAMGIIGKIDRLTDQTVILKMIDGSKIEMIKAAITEVQPAEGDASSTSPES